MNVKKISPSTDQELFILIAHNDKSAFDKIFNSYKKRLSFFVLKITKSETLTEEVVQSTFIKLWTNRSTLDKIDNPKAYIFTIATNAALDHLKKKLHESNMRREVMRTAQELKHNNIEEMIFLNESQSILVRAIEQLPPQRQLIYNLSRNEGKNYQEIAEQLKISKNTVRNQLVEALRSLRSSMQHATCSTLTLLITLLSSN